MRFHRSLLLGWAVVVTLLTAAGFQQVTEAAAAAMARGAKVTFSTVRGDKVTHSQRARLLSLAVERGETPTPYLPAGAFRAQFDAVVTLPARDRMKFRVDGRGKVKHCAFRRHPPPPKSCRRARQPNCSTMHERLNGQALGQLWPPRKTVLLPLMQLWDWQLAGKSQARGCSSSSSSGTTTS